MDTADTDQEPTVEPATRSWSRSVHNRTTTGDLVVHHASRDIVVTANGDAALRFIEFFTGAAEQVLDYLSHEYSCADQPWISIDLRGVVGVTWLPHDQDRFQCGSIVARRGRWASCALRSNGSRRLR